MNLYQQIVKESGLPWLPLDIEVPYQEMLEEANNISNIDISKYLKLPPVKLHCSMLMEDAIKAAIKDYTNKNS